MRKSVSLSPNAIRIINEILTGGGKVEVSMIGSRLRIVRVKTTVEYDVMIGETEK